MTDLTKAANGGEPLGVLRELAHDTQRELEVIGSEGAEINLLIKQTNSEVDRLAARASEASSRLREAEMTSDTYTRAEIRDLYAAVQEAEMRLFMMKGQLEQLEYKRESLDRYQKRLRRVVEVAQSVLDQAGQILGPAPAVEAAENPLRSVSQDIGKIIDAQEDERQRMARQIHDGPAQALANLILRAEICERLLENDPGEAKSELADLKNLVANTLRETRQFIFDLRPMILDDLGLVPTVRRHVDAVSGRTDTSIDVSVSGSERRLPAHVEIGLFRIIQEALDNAIAHARAKSIQISIELAEAAVRLGVDDDGVGFDVDQPLAPAKSSGLHGIREMQERAHSLGGKIRLDSGPGQGTRLHVEVPY